DECERVQVSHTIPSTHETSPSFLRRAQSVRPGPHQRPDALPAVEAGPFLATTARATRKPSWVMASIGSASLVSITTPPPDSGTKPTKLLAPPVPPLCQYRLPPSGSCTTCQPSARASWGEARKRISCESSIALAIEVRSGWSSALSRRSRSLVDERTAPAPSSDPKCQKGTGFPSACPSARSASASSPSSAT